MINYWLQLSIDYARQRSYLDDLFQVYPTIPEGIREINENTFEIIQQYFDSRNNVMLIKELLKLDLFPIKDSYIAYLRRDKSAIERNPRTINRICGRLYEIGMSEIIKRATEPKETNRQLGPMFKNWVRNQSLGIMPVNLEEFENNENDAILDASDAVMQRYAFEKLGFNINKGLDLLARFNRKYVIGEAKFLTDFGGHQVAQFNDAIRTVTAKEVRAVTVAIIDGVLFIKGKNKLYKAITGEYQDLNIMSALVLREFLYSL